MKILLLTITLMLYCITLKAQVSCEQMMKDAAMADSNKNYQDAILKYTAAKNCNPKFTEKAEEKILLIFNKIEKLNEDVRRQKDSAIAAKNAAVMEKTKADSLKNEADRSYKQANSLNKVFESKALLETDPTQALILANSALLIDSLYAASDAAYDALIRAYFNNHYYKVLTENKVSKIIGAGDANHIIIGYTSGAVKIKNINNGDVFSLKSHTADINDLYLTHDTLFSCADDRTIIVQTKNNKQIKILKNLPSICKVVKLSPTGLLVTGSVDGAVRFYDMHNNWELTKQLQDDNLFEIKNIFFSGNYLYAVSADGIWCWNFNDSSSAVFKKYYVNVQKAIFNAENKTIIIAYDSRRLAVVNSEGKEIISKQLQAAIADVINLNNNRILIEYQSGNIAIVNFAIQGLDNGKIEPNDQLALIGNNIVSLKDSVLKFWNVDDQFYFKPDEQTRFGILVDTINNLKKIDKGYYTHISIIKGKDTLKFSEQYGNEITTGGLTVNFKTDSAENGASSTIIFISKYDKQVSEIDKANFKIEDIYLDDNNNYFLIAGKKRNNFYYYLYPTPGFIKKFALNIQDDLVKKN